MHKLDNQMPDDLKTMQRDSIYIQILLRLRKEIEISTDGSLVKAGSEDIKGAAVFVTHRIEANFDIIVDKTLSSTKTETKAVLLALEAVPYKCKLTLNTDSQATPNWCIWNTIKAVIGEKRIDFKINKVAVYIEISENKMTNKLAKKAITFNTVRWAYNTKNTNYIPFCEEIELDLNIRHFLSQQIGLQAALDWINNDKVQETLRPLDQDINWESTTKV
ncbi:hypothetical protein G9A89_013584 [Geosiphon pyriformis]|nr:hypothetical protein G9A89_013584 [Geosiphon pyriformis]